MKRRIIPYSPHLKSYARELRRNSTATEIKLWNKLKRKQLHGLRFLRQRPMLEFIVDFYCPELNLVIELDGESHDDPKTIAKDRRKQMLLEKEGLTVVRFRDTEIHHRLDEVMEFLSEIALKEKEHSPNPSQEGN